MRPACLLANGTQKLAAFARTPAHCRGLFCFLMCAVHRDARPGCRSVIGGRIGGRGAVVAALHFALQAREQFVALVAVQFIFEFLKS